MAELSVKLRTALRSCASVFLVEAQRVNSFLSGIDKTPLVFREVRNCANFNFTLR